MFLHVIKDFIEDFVEVNVLGIWGRKEILAIVKFIDIDIKNMLDVITKDNVLTLIYSTSSVFILIK